MPEDGFRRFDKRKSPHDMISRLRRGLRTRQKTFLLSSLSLQDFGKVSLLMVAMTTLPAFIDDSMQLRVRILNVS
jgi:hypothetical protein